MTHHKIDLGFDPKQVRDLLDLEEWSRDGPVMFDEDQECRSVYIGRMIWPSGKLLPSGLGPW